MGDTITVVFRNNLTFPVNLDPSGLQNAESQASDSPSGGASPGTLSSTFAAVAQPGQTITYTWVVPQAAGPSPGEADYKMWMYRWGALLCCAVLCCAVQSHHDPVAGAGTGVDSWQHSLNSYEHTCS